MPHLSNSSGPPEPPGPPDSGRGTASGRRGTAERRLASAQHTIAWSMPPAVSGAGRAVTRPAAARKHLCLIVVCVRACACLRVLGRTPRWRWAWWRWAMGDGRWAMGVVAAGAVEPGPGLPRHRQGPLLLPHTGTPRRWGVGGCGSHLAADSDGAACRWATIDGSVQQRRRSLAAANARRGAPRGACVTRDCRLCGLRHRCAQHTTVGCAAGPNERRRLGAKHATGACPAERSRHAPAPGGKCGCSCSRLGSSHRRRRVRLPPALCRCRPD